MNILIFRLGSSQRWESRAKSDLLASNCQQRGTSRKVLSWVQKTFRNKSCFIEKIVWTILVCALLSGRGLPSHYLTLVKNDKCDVCADRSTGNDRHISSLINGAENQEKIGWGSKKQYAKLLISSSFIVLTSILRYSRLRILFYNVSEILHRLFTVFLWSNRTLPRWSTYIWIKLFHVIFCQRTLFFSRMIFLYISSSLE